MRRRESSEGQCSHSHRRRLRRTGLFTAKLFGSQYFCQRDAGLFDLAEPIPTNYRSAKGKSRNGHGRDRVGVRASRTGITTTPALPQHGRLVAGHLSEDDIGRSYITKILFHASDLVFALDTRWGRIGVRLLGPVVSGGGAHGSLAHKYSYPTAIGWHPREKVQFRHEAAGGVELMFRRTPCGTASMSQRSAAWATRDLPTAGWSSGAAHSSAILSARLKRRIVWDGGSDRPASRSWKRHANWPFSRPPY